MSEKMSNRSMLKLIHADGFFPSEAIDYYRNAVNGLHFTETEYGLEIPNFNMIFPYMEPLLGKVVGERVIIDHQKSGIFRKPIENIHFESFDSLNEWSFIVALEQTTLNLWYHLKESGMGEAGEADSWSALDGYNFNYRNLMEWNIHTNIILRPNQGVFIRPWVFRSLQNGLIQYYRLLSDRKFRILVMGYPGSSRKDIARTLNEKITNSYILESKKIREETKDIDFSIDGRMRQTYRLLSLARNRKEDCVIIDMVCPLPEMREILNPDIIIWANDVESCVYQEINNTFVKPNFYDIKCDQFNEKIIEEILTKIQTKRV
jgi:hypothetical protein